MLSEMLNRRFPRSQQIEKREVVQSPTGDLLETEGNAWATLIDMFGMTDPTTLTKTNATSFNTIFSCVNIISDDIAKMPWKVFKSTNGAIERKSDHAVDYLLTKRPNRYMTPFTLKKTLIVDLLTRGNAYMLIEYDDKGRVISLLPLSESVTSYVIDEKTGNAFYRTTYRGKQVDLFEYEVFHIKGLGNGFIGQNPVEVLRTQVETNHAADLANKALIQGGSIPKGVLRVPSTIGAQAKTNVRNEWIKAGNSTNAIAIIDGGLEYQQLGFSQVDMAYIESKKMNQQEVAAIFKLPLHKINQLDHSTFSNVEHLSLDYVKNTLAPLAVAIEEEANYKFFSEKELRRGFYTKFNFDSELRGDAKSRAEVMEIKLRNSIVTANECRGLDELSPFDIPLADEPLVTLNYTPLRRLEQYQYSGIDSDVLKNPSDSSTEPDTDESKAALQGGDE